MKKVSFLIILFFSMISTTFGADSKAISFLHVSFDVSREVFKAIDDAFVPFYAQKNGVNIKIEQSHAGASKQAKAVASGLPADLLSFNQFVDIQYIHDETKKQNSPVLADDWQKKFPNQSSPFSSTVAFVVRKGNPKGIHDWADLVKPGVQLILANPKSSATGRYGFLNAYAYGLSSGGTDAKAAEYWKSFIKAIPVLGNGGRDATTIFTERGLGDVLVTLEAEAYQILASEGQGKFDIVVPSYLIDAKIYVASTIKAGKSKETSDAAKAYWDFVYSPQGQEIVAKNFYRPIDLTVAAKYRSTLPVRKLVEVENIFGSWDAVQAKLFKEGALFDQIYLQLKKR